MLVSQNTVIGSRLRSGVVVDTDMANVRVVDNIFAKHEQAGIAFKRCGTGCLVDGNITWQNRGGAASGALASRVTNNRNVDPLFTDLDYRVGALSPAVDTARAAYAYFPAGDGVLTMMGGEADLGAYER